MLKIYSPAYHAKNWHDEDMNHACLATNSMFGALDGAGGDHGLGFPTLAAARKAIDTYRREFNNYCPISDFEAVFDCPVMQAAYDLGPLESKIV